MDQKQSYLLMLGAIALGFLLIGGVVSYFSTAYYWSNIILFIIFIVIAYFADKKISDESNWILIPLVLMILAIICLVVPTLIAIFYSGMKWKPFVPYISGSILVFFMILLIRDISQDIAISVRREKSSWMEIILKSIHPFIISAVLFAYLFFIVSELLSAIFVVGILLSIIYELVYNGLTPKNKI